MPLRKSTTKKRRARSFFWRFLRLLRFFAVDFHFFQGAARRDLKAYSIKSASDHVNNREHHNPDRVDKMPIPRNKFYALAVSRPHMSEQEQNHSQSEEGQSDDHVTGVEADQ